MTNKFYHILAIVLVAVFGLPSAAMASDSHEDGGLDVKEIIFEHLGDGYGWEVPFCHAYRIPLPVIVKAEDGKWFSFSSGSLTDVVVVEDEETGKKEMHLVPVIKKVERDGKTYEFIIAKVSSHKDKVVEIFPLSSEGSCCESTG